MSADPKPLPRNEHVIADLHARIENVIWYRTHTANGYTIPGQQISEAETKDRASLRNMTNVVDAALDAKDREIAALKADARAAKDRNGPLYRELAALKAEKNVPRSGPTPPDLADSPRAEVGISAGPLADDADLIDRLRCGYGSKIKLEVVDFVALDALAMEAGGRLSQRSAALRAVRELCDKRAHERRSEFAKLTVAEVRAAMEIAK